MTRPASTHTHTNTYTTNAGAGAASALPFPLQQKGGRKSSQRRRTRVERSSGREPGRFFFNLMGTQAKYLGDANITLLTPKSMNRYLSALSHASTRAPSHSLTALHSSCVLCLCVRARRNKR